MSAKPMNGSMAFTDARCNQTESIKDRSGRALMRRPYDWRRSVRRKAASCCMG